MGDRHRDGDALTSLWGRQRECATLDGLLDRVRGSRSAVLVLRGEPGIGKTALLRYVAEKAVGFSVARCMGVESEMELAFTGLHDLCAPMLSCLDALIEPQRAALNVALGLASGERPEPFMVALAALNLLAQAAEDRPLLCVIDDVQWLDQATAQVLGFVGRRLLAEPVGLVFAARTTAVSQDPLAGPRSLVKRGIETAGIFFLVFAIRITGRKALAAWDIAPLLMTITLPGRAPFGRYNPVVALAFAAGLRYLTPMRTSQKTAPRSDSNSQPFT